nr:putative ribonuclease H-like domain-containing protein [Tanacetum cinerariifolium]
PGVKFYAGEGGLKSWERCGGGGVECKVGEMEDIAYSYHENVGAETNFNNLETSITVSPIPTTRTHKAHPISQIIGDLSSTTQTRSMTRVIKDQCGLLQIFNDDFYTCMFACFLLQEEPKRILVDLPHGKREIGTKWVYGNKKDERCIVVRNKTRLVAQGHTQEEGIDYEEVFAPVAKIEAIRLFLAYASFLGFTVYQTDVKSAFLYGTIKEEVYVCQPLGFEDPDYPDKVYKVVKALYGLHQTPRACICMCTFQVTPKASHLHAVKRIFRHLNGKPYLGLWYLKDSPFDLVAYSNSDYGGASLDIKSTTRGCQFLRWRLISWQCKKQTVIATSSTEAEYVVGASCCAQVLWIQNQMLDYGLKLLLFSLTNWCYSISAVSYIEYVLTVNPTIYVSCIKQFWNTVAVKQSKDITRLQALVNRKKVVVTEAAIRDALRLDDTEGFDCLPNEEILLNWLTWSISTKCTSWNEFSSGIASAVICLSTCRKFNFSKYIFETLVRNVDSSSKFYMYPRVGKGCSEVETPLFEGMLVAREPEEQGDAEEHGTDDNAAKEPDTAISENDEALDGCAALARRAEHLEHDKVAQDLEIIKLKTRVKKLERANKVKALILKRLRKVGTSQRVDTLDDTIMDDVSNQGKVIDELDRDKGVVLMSEKEEKKAEEVKDITGDAQVKGRQADIYQIDMDHDAKVLIVVAVSETLSADAVVHAATVTAAPVKVAIPSTRRKRGVVIRDPKEESSAKTPTETKSKDKGKSIMVEKPKPIKKKQQVELDETYARKLHEELNQDIDWEVAIDHVKQKAKANPYVQRLDYFNGMSYDEIRPIFEAKFNSNIKFLLKSKEQIEEEENRAIESINETPAQKAAKRRRLNEEAKDVEKFKHHLKIVPDEDNDVYTEATPLARKVPVVDYQIVHFNNKPHYKIIRADGTHQLYELICREFELLALHFELNRFGILLDELREGQIASSGGPFVSIVFSHVTHPVASMTLDSARSLGKASSIPTVFSWGGSISTEGFLPFILLLAVIIVAVAIFVTVVLIVVDAIIRVVVGGGVSSIIKRTMAQLLQAPTEGYEDAIVVPAITADNFELKHGLLTLVQNKQFFGHDKEDPHAHVRYFNKITSTLNEALDRFKELLRACPHHGFSELHQLDTFYNALNSKDQDSLNFAAGGNFLDKMPRECLAIIESKSKVRYLCNKPVVAKVSTNTSTSGISPDVAELKDMVKALLLDKKGQNQSHAPVKSVEESCITCGGNYSYRNCPATDGN